MMSFAILIPCGPAAAEYERVIDLLDAISYYEPGCALVLIINDGNPAVDRIVSEARDRLHIGVPIQVLQNPRNGAGWGWAGGLVCGELAGLACLASRFPDLRFVLKLDTDALPVAPFSDKLCEIFEDPTVGMAGSRIIDQSTPSYKQTKPFEYFRNKTEKMLAPLSLWRKPTWHFRSPWLDRRVRRIAVILRQAIRQGYKPGELIEGGAFAWSGEYARGVVKTGIDQEREAILHLNVSDDLFLTPLSYYLGLRCVESSLFCVEPESLRFDLATMLNLSNETAILHSVKGASPAYESEVRAAFRARRRKPSNP